MPMTTNNPLWMTETTAPSFNTDAVGSESGPFVWERVRPSTVGALAWKQ